MARAEVARNLNDYAITVAINVLVQFNQCLYMFNYLFAYLFNFCF